VSHENVPGYSNFPRRPLRRVKGICYHRRYLIVLAAFRARKIAIFYLLLSSSTHSFFLSLCFLTCSPLPGCGCAGEIKQGSDIYPSFRVFASQDSRRDMSELRFVSDTLLLLRRKECLQAVCQMVPQCACYRGLPCTSCKGRKIWWVCSSTATVWAAVATNPS
jgi:hypothetical protein